MNIQASSNRLVSTIFLLLTAACRGETIEGLGPVEALPPTVRVDYEVFAQRCSKCHSLARPLNSGIEDDEFWRMYVERMRRQPGSGISREDTVPILRFLSYFSREQRAKRLKTGDAPQPAPPTPPQAAEPIVEAGAP
jgi:hypothetical protein